MGDHSDVIHDFTGNTSKSRDFLAELNQVVPALESWKDLNLFQGKI
jgi:hypothetical protein